METRSQETGGRGKMNRSLSARVLRAALVCCIALGVVALLAGLTFYTYSLSRQLIDKAYSASHSAAMSASNGASAGKLAMETMEIYRSMTPSEQADPYAPSYRARFAALEDTYKMRVVRHILDEFRESSDVSNVYVGVFEPETSRLVYVCDPSLGETPVSGVWREVPQGEITRFLEYDGEGKLYYIGYRKGAGWTCTAGVPINANEDGTGERVAFLCTDVTLASLIAGMRAFALQFTILQLILTALIAFLLTRRMRRMVVEPINAIAAAAKGYVEDKRSGAVEEEHFSALDIHTGDEIENLSRVMADMERDITEFETDLTAVTAEKERISTELNMAAAIQAQVLPGIFPPFPDRREFDIFASMTPAKEVGGDFYDFFMVDPDHLALVIGDVSGKGIPAALFMMTSRTMLRDAAMTGADPAAVLSRVNAQLCENNQECMFVTVWLGILEISTGKLTCADAGHEPMLLQRGSAWQVLTKDGMASALGVFEPEFIDPGSEFDYRNRELTLLPGDGIFLYTDGVTEAMTEAGKQFGYDRLRNAVGTAPSCAPEDLLPHVHRAVNEYADGAPQFDDITMLALRFFGENGAAGV